MPWSSRPSYFSPSGTNPMDPEADPVLPPPSHGGGMGGGAPLPSAGGGDHAAHTHPVAAASAAVPSNPPRPTTTSFSGFHQPLAPPRSATSTSRTPNFVIRMPSPPTSIAPAGRSRSFHVPTSNRSSSTTTSCIATCCSSLTSHDTSSPQACESSKLTTSTQVPSVIGSQLLPTYRVSNRHPAPHHPDHPNAPAPFYQE